jgi:hypothetical protein
LDLNTLLLAAVMLALPLLGAGLLGAIILLERPEPISPAAANGVASRSARRHPRRNAARRRR